MNPQDFFEQMILEQLKAKAKRELNKGLAQPFEIIVNLKRRDENSIEVKQAFVCNN